MDEKERIDDERDREGEKKLTRIEAKAKSKVDVKIE
jgi:hypothetical protein